MSDSPAGPAPTRSDRLHRLPALGLLCRLGRHRRARAERYRDADGLIKSVCVRCGVRMVRERQSGQWLVHGDRDRRHRTRPMRRALDQLTGPVLFLLLLAGAFGLVVYLRGQALIVDKPPQEDLPLAARPADAPPKQPGIKP